MKLVAMTPLSDLPTTAGAIAPSRGVVDRLESSAIEVVDGNR